MVLLYVFEIYLVLNAAYLIVFSLAGFLHSKQNKNPVRVHNKILTILPTYKEDSVIVDSARAALNQDYPAALHQVVVLSDMLLPATNSKLVELGATVCIIPNFEVRNKAKSINYFLQNNAVDADYVLILDADNIIEPNYIQGLNEALCGGAHILQTKRIAKNDENTMSKLDGLSEIINNHIFRMGQVNLGLSASLIGSGMAFKTSVFKELMAGMEVVSGFDKELEIRIFKQGYNIAYAPHLTVKDEKVGENVVFINQRRRWFFAQIYFLRKYLPYTLTYGIAKGNLDLLNKLWQFAMLPRIAMLGVVFINALCMALMGKGLATTALITLIVSVVAIALPVAKVLPLTQYPSLIVQLPKAFISMLVAMFTSAKAAKKFIHTPHKTQY